MIAKVIKLMVTAHLVLVNDDGDVVNELHTPNPISVYPGNYFNHGEFIKSIERTALQTIENERSGEDRRDI